MTDPAASADPPITFLGVRHHSPACARLVRDTIRARRPAHVLIEGPADMNDRLDELLLGHDLPIAIYTGYRDHHVRHRSWAPLCDYSPEWLALTEGRAAGAEVRFIDLPAWHPAFADTENRFSDTERRYESAVTRLCREFAVDNIDTLWDHLFEIDSATTGNAVLAERLAAYFDLVRGNDEAGAGDTAREEYMARWVSVAVADVTHRPGPPSPIVVVTGGFHRPALVRRLRATLERSTAPAMPATGAAASAAPAMSATSSFASVAGGSPAEGGVGDATGETSAGVPWPEVPRFPEGAVGGSYLVPFGFRRLDAFGGYQAGMPSPAYYQQVWHEGTAAAAEGLVAAVVGRLRARRQAVSTADLIGARTLALGLARLRGHESPSRTDTLDGLAGALITEALDRPLPWTGRGQLRAGTDPIVVEMVAALSGDTVGRLHRDTQHPPLVHDAAAELVRCGIPEGEVTIDLAAAPGLDSARVLHRLRILGIPGFERRSGPSPQRGALTERWSIQDSPLRLPALIEAGSYGATCAEAAAAALVDRFGAAGSDPGALAGVLFDAALCGLPELTARIVGTVRGLIGSASDTAGLGTLLTVILELWRHDRLFAAAGSAALGTLADITVRRLLWLVEGLRGGPGPADEGLLRAIVAVRDAALHAAPALAVDRADLVGVFRRCTAADRPPALRGAALGLVTALGAGTADTVAAAVRSAAVPRQLGDFLAGLFALARDTVLENGSTDLPVLAVLDELVDRFGAEDFLAALPALRLAFAWFPPRERAELAQRLLARRGLAGSGTSLLRTSAAPEQLARAAAIEERADRLLTAYALAPNSAGSVDD
ncbi:DUF5682 family protein [Nocardia sp. alder85J]|uniref:DUF5682 family protein n=1 Tax=Nocardia sp. alder85J TaxID=2862949 RepID=UPI001CD5CC66|nr:DUF5682 family protein [Nocardia sp. alder85J]MCX4094887.1 DUF5682 family protein [Nocardia sp. alder85J]